MSDLTFDLRLETTALRQNISRAEVRQALGKHTLVVVSTNVDIGTVSQQTYIPEGTPTQITWGRAINKSAVWYGYCHHHQVTTDGRLQYLFLGTSNIFNSAYSRSWRDVTDSHIIRQLATDNGFRSYIHATGRIVDYTATETDTDFQFMNRLADRNGYRLWIDGATVFFTSPREAVVSPWLKSVPIFRYDGAAADTIINLDITQGTAVPLGGLAARRVTYGMDESSGRILEAVANPHNVGRTLVEATSTSTSYADALAWAEAVAARNDDWVRANLRLAGDVRVAPGNLLQLAGSRLPLGSTGLWLVEEAVHTLDLTGSGNYVTEVVLGRNATSAYRISSVRQQEAGTEFGYCKSQNSQWRSANLQEVIYG